MELQELYGLGARRIGVVSLPAIGCVPSLRTLSGGIDRGCSETANQAASLFNSKLSAQIDAFNGRLPEARLVYLDIYNTLLSLIQNPTQYGKSPSWSISEIVICKNTSISHIWVTSNVLLPRKDLSCHTVNLRPNILNVNQTRSIV